MKNIKLFIALIAAVFALSLATNVHATSNNTTVNTTINDTSDSELALNALNVRYEHLYCKIVFTNGQLDLLEDFTNNDIGLSDQKDKLEQDLEKLKDLKENNDRAGFDYFVANTIIPDMKDAKEVLDNAKSDFNDDNITREQKNDLKEKLKSLKEEYSDCVSERQVKMANIVLKQYDKSEDRWNGIIGSMDKFNISTEELEKIKAELEDQAERLEDAIDSGNDTLIRETLAQIREEHQHLWARFEITRLNGYMNKMGPLAEKYGMSGKIDEMRGKMKNIEQYTAQGRKYSEGESKEVWKTLHETGKDMRETSKEMLKERVKEMREEQKGMNEGNGRGRK